MATHNNNDFSSPQEAIEGYLEALLEDVSDYDEVDDESFSEPKADVRASTAEPKDLSDTKSVAEGIAKQSFTPTEPSIPSFETAPMAQTQVLPDAVPTRDVAYKEAPAVVMPELQIAEESAIEDTQVAEPILDTVEVQAEVDIEPTIAEPVIEVESYTPEPVIEESLAVEDAIPEVIIDDITETITEVETELQPQENEGWTQGRPNWAQERFECLLFVVKGLKLAVPLAELGGIHKQEKEPTPLFGQPSWFLGILRNNRMNIGLVDTAQWVMPEYINGTHSTDYRFAIHIHNSEWGLACDEVAEAISLDPSQVKWRTKLGRRPWLAGTVVDHMCALIDVAAFARLLDSDKVPVDLQALDADDE